VKAKCTGGCEDPDLLIDMDNTIELDYDWPTKVRDRDDYDSPTKIEERDSGFTSQLTASLDLAFVSQSSGVPLSSLYTYDKSAGAGVFAYILDSKGYDLTLPVSRHHIFLSFL